MQCTVLADQNISLNLSLYIHTDVYIYIYIYICVYVYIMLYITQSSFVILLVSNPVHSRRLFIIIQ